MVGYPVPGAPPLPHVERQGPVCFMLTVAHNPPVGPRVPLRLELSSAKAFLFVRVVCVVLRQVLNVVQHHVLTQLPLLKLLPFFLSN